VAGAHVPLLGFLPDSGTSHTQADQGQHQGGSGCRRPVPVPKSCATSHGVRRTRIFRQASRSGVVTNAHRINPGEYRQLRSLVDFFLFHADDADTAAGLTVDVTPAATSRC